MKLRKWRMGLRALCWLLPSIAWAQASEDALQWLQRVASSAEKLNYGGVFVYRSGNNSETSRITHFSDGSREREVLEVLDGSPREVVRDNDETRCYLPESRLVVVERHSSRRSFPALSPGGLGALTDYYAVSKRAVTRMAGYKAQLLQVDARDDLRYSRQFWIEANTGLLLKAVLLGENGEPRESFAFTDLKIGGVVDRAALAGHVKAKAADWRVHNVRVVDAGANGLSWGLRASIPGFRMVSAMLRQTSPTAPEVTHMVLSDGLAAISVFVEPLAPGKFRGEGRVTSMGAMNVYRRSIGDMQVTVIGDVPPLTLKRVADNVEAKHK
ncbi:MAG TPA: MucB/RseB C-terminal domain-containing protein [Rhodocyclaceae bacterium]|nr:MucB/RseB C-terminal domain-containing protein [Rhodocyclaceae bacterium]